MGRSAELVSMNRCSCVISAFYDSINYSRGFSLLPFAHIILGPTSLIYNDTISSDMEVRYEGTANEALEGPTSPNGYPPSRGREGEGERSGTSLVSCLKGF